VILRISRCYTGADLMELIVKARGHDGKTAALIIIPVQHIGAFSSLFLLLLESRIVDHMAPRSFKYERDAEGVVRHWSRMQVTSSKNGFEKVDWAPFNSDGHRLFPRGFPDLTAAKVLPELALDCAAVNITLTVYRLLMSDDKVSWLEQLLAANRASVANQCAVIIDVSSWRLQKVKATKKSWQGTRRANEA